jgi:hypothetical protein
MWAILSVEDGGLHARMWGLGIALWFLGKWDVVVHFNFTGS